jgi:UDP-N-acetylmuramyl pentapeptide phosphotransferase/UDP-N-acetylglucosamine-1-phosphate transferase
MLPLIVAMTISFVLCFAFTKSSKLLNGFVRRHDLSAVQSMHTRPTLRLAGVAIFVSIFITKAIFEPGSQLLSTLLLSSLPLLALGLLEDVGLHQSPSRRLLSSIVAGGVFIAITGTYLQNPGTFLLDALFEYWVIAAFFTLFITSGSFDQYANFKKHGDDFVARVKALKVENERLKLGVGRDYEKRFQQG